VRDSYSGNGSDEGGGAGAAPSPADGGVPGGERDSGGRFRPGHGLAALGGEARALARSERAAALAEELAANLPPLDSPENCRRSVELIQRYAALGAMPGTVVHGMIRAAEIALRAQEVHLDLVRLRELEAKLAELEAERARERRGPAVRAL
jgi:hypothetical protein